MLRRPHSFRRKGTTAVEGAVVYSATITLLLGLLIGGMGIFRYQQMAWLAREAARYACVRGSDYQKSTGKPSPTRQQIQSNVVEALSAALQPGNLTVQVQWIDMNTGTVYDWDKASKTPTTTSSSGQMISSHVRVTVTYQWVPEAFLAGPITLTSTCEIPMAN